MALADACAWLADRCGVQSPFAGLVAAVSVGLVNGRACLDLDYTEDKVAEVDANVVMREPDRFVEVQGTSEGTPFARDDLEHMLDLARGGIAQLFAEQRKALER